MQRSDEIQRTAEAAKAAAAARPAAGAGGAAAASKSATALPESSYQKFNKIYEFHRARPCLRCLCLRLALFAAPHPRLPLLSIGSAPPPPSIRAPPPHAAGLTPCRPRPQANPSKLQTVSRGAANPGGSGAGGGGDRPLRLALP